MQFETNQRKGQMCIHVVQNNDLADSWIQQFVIEPCVKIIGLDIEWKPVFIKGQPPRKASLLQIAASDEILLLQIYGLQPKRIPQLVLKVLADTSILKVGVGIEDDAARYPKPDSFLFHEMVKMPVASVCNDYHSQHPERSR
jgi:hypothetical protein